MMKVDVLQVFISTSAIFGIGLIWINFSEKVFKTVRRLAAAPLYSSDYSDEEEGYWSDESSEACPQISKPPPSYQLETD